MNYATIKYCDIANGEGVRTSLFVSGCRRGCPFCFNEAAWNFKAGTAFTPEVEDQIIASLAPSYIDGLTVLGGEPMEPENQAGLVDFLERVRKEYSRSAGKTIWIYTGDVLEAELLEGGRHHTEFTDRILATADILVDGPFVQELHDISLRFRGSSNQRIIDVPATLARIANGVDRAQAVALWQDDPLYAERGM
ncbi:anaerobic ribonucleoside-triphosphate reductase activating protein [Collinsella sp. AGMB00827]|uniref:Anaerobic ribonucleoside-triphosphate reductase-activating protein n=1 Tax=Collinsella ureilytica TaxID=2869515 RepID=A0ABS7MI84_9ACTN|nr:anaerobic ribonucleoside-triphosphate reductase activating protein [Collinsella urealyticum]MBY4797023.1 anaerobic ribonucleoside-triphosphate reductase activating protein [Collinsella urealyticum]